MRTPTAHNVKSNEIFRLTLVRYCKGHYASKTPIVSLSFGAWVPTVVWNRNKNINKRLWFSPQRIAKLNYD